MLHHYKYAFAHLNRNKLRGEVALHKLVLLLAIIDYVEEKLLTTHFMLAVESVFQGIQFNSKLMQLIIQQDTRQ